MSKDFLELFSHLNTNEVYEPDLYKLAEEIHELMRFNVKKSIPNAVRRFYECFLSRCLNQSEGFRKALRCEYKLRVKNISETSRILFRNDEEYYEKNIKRFLKLLNSGSHWKDYYEEPDFICTKEGESSYAPLKSSDQISYVKFLIDVWNWYAHNIRHMEDKYLIRSSYTLPKSIYTDFVNIKNKLASKVEQVKNLKDELDAYKEEDQPIDADELEKDIYESIKLFNEKNIYCTHKTVALFLLGTRIAQTEFCKLEQYELFAKYSKPKFSEFEYDLALQTLMNKEKVIQNDSYFRIWDRDASALKKFFIKLNMKIQGFRPNKSEFRSKINKKFILSLQTAIDERKNVEVLYTKTDRNTGKKETSKKILTPIIMVPKDSMYFLKYLQDIFDKDNFDKVFEEAESHKYTEDFYYLGAVDSDEEKKDSIRTYRLDGFKKVKIL